MRTMLGVSDLRDLGAVRDRLLGGGLSPREAQKKSHLFALCGRALEEAGSAPSTPARAFFVPGRIEVLGKHTDYAGGRSLLAAMERGLCLVAAERADALIRAVDAMTGEAIEFSLSAGAEAVPPLPWSRYPLAVARRAAANFPGMPRGMDAAFAGDLPPAAGMSSSSALVTAFFMALSAVNALPSREEYRARIHSREDLAAYLGAVENGEDFGGLPGGGGVGTFGGSEDHTAILCCRPGYLSLYSFRPVRPEGEVILPAGRLFAVAASGVVSEKTGASMAKYNRASLLARAIAEAWNRATNRDDPHIGAALAAGPLPAQAEAVRKALSGIAGPFTEGELSARFDQFLQESEHIIPAAAEALARGAIEEFGRQADASQRLAETRLGNQVPETTALARMARELGAEAASAFGAGFGGAVWALVRADAADDFLRRWREEYAAAFPEAATASAFFLTRPGPAAFEA